MKVLGYLMALVLMANASLVEKSEGLRLGGEYTCSLEKEGSFSIEIISQEVILFNGEPTQNKSGYFLYRNTDTGKLIILEFMGRGSNELKLHFAGHTFRSRCKEKE